MSLQKRNQVTPLREPQNLISQSELILNGWRFTKLLVNNWSESESFCSGSKSQITKFTHIFCLFYRLSTWSSFMFICRNWIYWHLVYCSVPVALCCLVGTNTTFTTLNPQQTACTLRPHSVVPAFTAFPSQCKSCYSHVSGD